MRSLTKADIVFSDSRDRPIVLNLPLLVRFPELQPGSGLMFLSASIMAEEIQGFETTEEMEVPPFLIFAIISLSKNCLTLGQREVISQVTPEVRSLSL